MIKRLHKRTIYVFISLLSVFSSQASLAHEASEHVYLSPMFGRIFPMSNKQWSQAKLVSNDSESTPVYGLALGLDKKKYRANFTFNTANWSNADYRSIFIHYEKPYALKRLFNVENSPFMRDMHVHGGVGLGLARFSDDLSNSSDMGLGFNLYAGINKPINHRWQVFTQVGYQYLGLKNEFKDVANKNHEVALKGPLLLQLGVRYYIHFPKQDKPVNKVEAKQVSFAKFETPETPVDSDGDGISDEFDKCAGTKAGAQVDSKGCDLDGDSDGVNDKWDACPGTAAGAKVNAVGCEIDSDGDGILDSADACPNSIPDVNVNSKGCASFEGIIDGLSFKTNTAELTPSSRVVLDGILKDMKKYPDLVIEIVGHTDSIGSFKANQLLSDMRATSVLYYLIAKGGDKNRILSRGMGEREPIASNMTEAGRAKNRRVEFIVVKQR